MISSHIINKVKYTIKIMEYMENNSTLKYKDLIKGVKHDLTFNQRDVERYMKTCIFDSPKKFYEKRKLTIAINDMIDNSYNIKTICKKYKYNDKKELNRKCKTYFNADIERIIENKELYNLQEKITEEDMINIYSLWESTTKSLKLSKFARVKRKDNIYKIELTLDKMPVYVLPQSTYNSIKNEFRLGNFDLRGFLMRIAVVDKGIRENTNHIKFNPSESEVINTCYEMYNLMKPINLDGMSYIGLDDNIVYRFLENKGIAKRIKVEDLNKAKQIKVRYLGASAGIPLYNDALCYHFFTKNMESDLENCMVDFSLDLRQSELSEIIDNMYLKYKDKLCELDGIDKDLLSDDMIKALHKKINTFRYGDIITVSVVENRIVSIDDFYPKAKLTNHEEIISLANNMINTIKDIYENGIKINNTVMASGYEIINKLIRFCQYQNNEDIVRYAKDNFNKLDKFEDKFVDLSSIYIGFINKKISEEEVIFEADKLFEKIYNQRYILEELIKNILLI